MKFSRKKQTTDQNQRRRPAQANQPGVFSYYSQRSGAPVTNAESTGRREEQIKNPLKRFNLRLGYLPSYIALLAVVVGALYSLWLQPVPRISVVSQANTVHRSNETYQKEIEEIWRSSLLNQTKLTVRSGTIRADILEHFAELADVQVELPLLGRRPAIRLTPARPAMQLLSNTGTYYVNSSGKVMSKITDVTQNQLAALPIVLDQGGLDAEVGKTVLPQQQAQYIQKLHAQLLAAGVTIQSVTLPSNAANEADVRIEGTAYYIKFSTDTEPRQAVGSYLAARDDLATKGITPAQYIDVRVEEKVFYL